MIIVQGLVSTKDAEVRRKDLNKLENDRNLTFQNRAEYFQWFIDIRPDPKDTEVSGMSHINKV